MDWSLRDLRFFVTAAEAGSFTEAAGQLFVSQAAVSRTIAGFERQVGDQLLRRTVRGCEVTGAGAQLLPEARRVLAEAERFNRFLTARHRTLRLGYAWAALGVHTPALQRQWPDLCGGLELELLRHNSPTSGLAEGLCDVAIMRREVNAELYDSVVVGLERRLVVFAADDPQWARRRVLSMSELADRTVFIDTRMGATDPSLWADAGQRPRFLESSDVDSWLDGIVAGRGVGTTAEATAHHHPRPSVAYRPLRDGPRIAVRLAWHRNEPPEGLGELISLVTRLYS
ncbi:LysR family transcriptional regulator [Glutamicibacter sp. MNS18]|uniref:LysR family transcriptional regulator n=1 Tax=Glutamicibacter sp. MNS18 TaxID=2989817 RepID=UPI002236AC94|nr:LysR family transcriptional regulator [Glutamicibacter sp. MNS18]MCW4465553.1 LysR family transcriptional regulator [Glutamicibacter sp. MNS18]